MIQSVCVSCKKPYVKNSRQKKQKYCSDPSCQKARKAKWQRDNLKSSPIYRKDQLQANKDWHSKEPDYWKTYRKKNPQKTLRNTLLQRKRNQKRCLNSFGRLGGNVKAKLIAKMDVLKSNNRAALTECWVVPVIAKMDVIRGYLSVNYEDPLRLSDRFL
jgi:hypothetical protein